MFLRKEAEVAIPLTLCALGLDEGPGTDPCTYAWLITSLIKKDTAFFDRERKVRLGDTNKVLG